eukprot:4725967-Alexandrium_andersonii.AAC.1
MTPEARTPREGDARESAEPSTPEFRERLAALTGEAKSSPERRSRSAEPRIRRRAKTPAGR